jgi:hypothetical protein
VNFFVAEIVMEIVMLGNVKSERSPNSKALSKIFDQERLGDTIIAISKSKDADYSYICRIFGDKIWPTPLLNWATSTTIL